MKMHVSNSSWIESISYLRAEDRSTYLAVFLKGGKKGDAIESEDSRGKYRKEDGETSVALLYAGVESWLPGLLMAGLGGRSVGRAYGKLVKGKYMYQRVEGKEKVRELRKLMDRTNNRKEGRT